MKLAEYFSRHLGRLAPLLLLCLVSGCATPSKVDWAARVGTYTFDQAVTELGPPDKAAALTDGTTVDEWLLYRGQTHGYIQASPGFLIQRYNEIPSPDMFLRLTFDRERKLKAWKRVWK